MEGGRWGLVIVASAFFIQVFAFGISASIGVYNMAFLDYFDNDTVGVSLISSINWAVFLGSGPFCSFLMTKMSYRKISLLGSVMVAVGIFLMPFLPYIPALCICFGVLAGLGSCMVYVPSHVLCGLYFKQHQSLSTGIATSGSGLGGAIMPIVIGNLIDHYGWKGSLIIVAGMELHLLIFAALLRSPPTVSDRKKSSDALALLEISNSKGNSIPNSSNVLMNQEEIPRAVLAVPEDAEELNIEVDYKHSEVIVSSTTENLNGDLPNQETERSVLVTESQPAKIPQSNKQDLETCTGEKPVVSSDADKGNVKVLRHVYLFTDVGFDVYFISSILWNATAASVLSFGPELTAESGISAINSAWLLTILGLGDFVGGIFGGVIGTIWTRHRMTQYIFANFLMGVSFFCLPFGSTFGEFASIMFFGGLAFGIVLGLLVVVLIDLIGSENLRDGLGYIMLSNGIGAFCGPALTGYIRKVSGSYDLAFYLTGVLGVLAGAIMWLIPVIYRLCPHCDTSKPSTSTTEYVA